MTVISPGQGIRQVRGVISFFMTLRWVFLGEVVILSLSYKLI